MCAYELQNCFAYISPEFHESDLYRIIEPEPASREQLLEFHSKEYIGTLKRSRIHTLDFVLKAEHMDTETKEYKNALEEFGLETYDFWTLL